MKEKKKNQKRKNKLKIVAEKVYENSKREINSKNESHKIYFDILYKFMELISYKINNKLNQKSYANG